MKVINTRNQHTIKPQGTMWCMMNIIQKNPKKSSTRLTNYGFTDEELDFIINYDIKYRMGDELNEE